MADEKLRAAVITGGAGAIGAAIARRLAARGVSVILVDRDLEGMAQLIEALTSTTQAKVRSVVVDLADAAAAQVIMQSVEEYCGRLDYLVNAAGANRRGAVGDVKVDDWDVTLDVNLRAPALISQAALPFWRRQNSGAIVNIGSRVWLSGAGAAYTASKAGLVGLTRALATELGRYNVTVNAVAPSYLNTKFNAGRSPGQQQKIEDGYRKITPIPRLGTVEDVAGAVSFLLSDDASYISGEVLHVCGGAQLAASPIAHPI